MKHTLKLNKDFRRLYARGKSVAFGCVAVYSMRNRLGSTRLGLTVGKTIGKAHDRNRAKRLMRESFYQLSSHILGGYDIIIVARTRIKGKKCREVYKDVYGAFLKLGLIK